MNTRISQILLISASAAFLSAADWPAYRGSNTDGSTEETISETNWKSSLKEVWKTEAQLGFSSFCVADGKAYTLMSREIEGNPMEVCVALDAATGKELWAQQLWIRKVGGGGDSGEKDNKGGDGPRSTPTFDNGKLYVIDSNVRLYCFDANSGKTLWKHDVLKEYSGENIRWENAASPVIDGDLVFMAGGGRRSGLLAFNKEDGSLAWKGENDLMTHATPIVANVLGTRQVIFFTQEGLVGVTLEKGEVLWRYSFPFKTSTAASPVVFEDIVYCSAGYGVGAGAVKVSKSGSKWKAEEIWRTENKNMNHWSTPVCVDGYLYGMFSFKDYGVGPLACVDIRTGEQKWSEGGFGPGNVILTGDSKVLALGDRGQLVLVDSNPKRYNEIARAKKVIGGKCWSTPVLSGGRIYLRSVAEAVCLGLGGKLVSR